MESDKPVDVIGLSHLCLDWQFCNAVDVTTMWCDYVTQLSKSVAFLWHCRSVVTKLKCYWSFAWLFTK